MLTENQITEIRKYLLSKKLSFDLFLEVGDHFVSQISELMTSKNIGFEEAFLQTKILWMGELKMVKASILSFKKISVIEKKILEKRLNRILLNSFLILPFLFGLNYLFPEIEVYILIFLISIIFLLVGLSFLKKKLKINDYLFLGFHPLLLKILLIGYLLPFLMMPIFTSFISPNEMMEFFKNHIWLSAFAGITQIQMLYLNLKNKKVML